MYVCEETGLGGGGPRPVPAVSLHDTVDLHFADSGSKRPLIIDALWIREAGTALAFDGLTVERSMYLFRK